MSFVRLVGLNGDNQPEDVRDVQEFLNDFRADNGLELIVVDGLVGPATIGAIKGFQAAQGGDQDGQIVLAESSSGGVAGQGDGDTLKEACEAAKADCKAKAGCAQGDTLKTEKCFCWRGGTQVFTCQVKCSCQSPVA
ncbi:peptidoglycan-binding domain-containing protein [Streptomyces decoyicus]|uniref:peptidoglycan-binding domain-containing protein n=1 Tax=Streptomyces decoyicus TaxID=249567 RepID=UPI001366500A|nr:peptidoglycan-binding domain-containing protein [Streptomyces decoyicus]QZY20237.1 peptidoglycan-binding protein [Streptomyces decoyicus]